MKKREKIILACDNKLGKKYEVKELTRGYIINYLLPRREILFYNEKNLSRIKKEQAKTTEKNQLLEVENRELYEKINNFSLDFVLNKNEKGEPFGSITSNQIETALLQAGFLVKKNQLLDFQPLRKLGENLVKLRISNKLVAQIKVIIN